MSVRVRRWIRRGTKALVVVVVLAVALAWAADAWILPAVIRAALRDGVAEVWDGPITVTGVRFSYRGLIDLEEVRLEDDQGRSWLEARDVRVRLRNWPGRRAAPGDVDVGRLHLHLRPSPPVRRPPERVEPADPEAVAPERVNIHALTVSASGAEGWANLEPVAVAMVRHQDRYTLRLDSLPPHQGTLRVRASLDAAAGRVEVDARVDRAVEPHEARLVGAYLGGSGSVEGVRGRVVGVFEADGTLGEADGFEVRGAGELLDGSAVVAERVAVEDLAVDWRFGGGRVRLEDLSCRMLDGRLAGRAEVDFDGAGVAVWADILARGVDLALLLDPAGDGTVGEAVLDGEVTVAPSADRAMEVHGRGRVRASTGAGPVDAVGGPVVLVVGVPTTGAEAWRPRGEITFDNWRVSVRGIEDAWVDVAVGIDGRRLTFERIEADVAEGAVNASGTLTVGGPAFELGVTATDVRGDLLAKALGASAGRGEVYLGLRADVTGALGGTPRLHAVGTTSARTGAAGVDRVEGAWELALMGLSGRAVQGRAALTDWRWHHGGEDLAHLERAVLQTSDGRRVLGEVLLTAGGGTVEGRGRLRLDGQREHQWQVTCRDVDVAALLGAEGLAATVSLDGTIAGEGMDELTARADGRADVDWPQRDLRAGAAMSLEAALSDEPAETLAERLTVVADITEGRVAYDGHALITALGGTIRTDRGRPPWARVSAEAIGGTIRVDLLPTAVGGAATYHGQVDLSGVDLAQLPEAWGTPPWLEQAVIDGRFTVERGGRESLGVRGEGRVVGRADVLAGYAGGGDFELDGRLSGLGAAGPPAVHGSGRLRGWHVSTGSTAVIEGFNVHARAFGRSVDVGGIRGRLLGGRATGAFRVDMKPDEPVRTLGWIRLEDLALDRLAAAVGRPETDVAGRVDFAYRFRADRAAPDVMRGSGVFEVLDSRMVGVPALTAILAALDVRPESASDTDVFLTFTNAGSVLTLTDGRVATPVVAISPRPGGTVNLATRELDVRVVAAALADLEAFLDVPFLELVVPFARRATQLHVTGTWDRRDAIRIRKEPLKDLGTATVNFFKGVVETGGDLSESFTEPARDIAPW
ncbi:MAG: hypothetical protein ACOC95_04835 [Planctomycetota bacterium]